MKRLVLVAFLGVVIAVSCMLSVSYAYISDDEDFDVGQTESWTWAYISAYFPPRYYNFHHDYDFDFAPGYWGPPPYVQTSPGEGMNDTYGYTKVELSVYQGANLVERVRSEADVPPPD
jgi:hypothetical protein